MSADWTRGVFRKDNPTPEGLRASARLALKHGREWVATAERLLAKADDLEQEPNR